MAATVTATSSFSIGEALSQGWEIFKEKWAFIYLIGVVTLIANMIPSVLGQSVGDSGNVTLMVLLQILIFIWNSAIAMGVMYLILKVSRKQEVEISEFTTPLPNLGNYLLGTVLYSLIVMVGFILLIVPGIIFSLKYIFVPFLIVDKGMGPGEALAASDKMTNGAKGKLFLFFIACVAINILGVIPLFLGLLLTVPMTTLAQYVIYNTLLPKLKL